MVDRYWEPEQFDQLPEILMDWVSENVSSAVKSFWEDEDNKPVVWVDFTENRPIFRVIGPRKPTQDDPSGCSDNYAIDFDIFNEFIAYSDPYGDIGGPRGERQRTHMRQIADQLRRTANFINSLAASAEILGADPANNQEAP